MRASLASATAFFFVLVSALPGPPGIDNPINPDASTFDTARMSRHSDRGCQNLIETVTYTDTNDIAVGMTATNDVENEEPAGPVILESLALGCTVIEGAAEFAPIAFSGLQPGVPQNGQRICKSFASPINNGQTPNWNLDKASIICQGHD